jgi:WhiB family transcriptional regulator, redox-sensing transcriptional regulator
VAEIVASAATDASEKPEHPPAHRICEHPPAQASAAWRQRAACRGRPSELWFAVDPVAIEVAKAICRSCPVRDDCERYALDQPKLVGVWGALTEAERAARRRQDVAIAR